MPDITQIADDGLAPLRTANGGFAMVALDQRESLRGMFSRESSGELADDARLQDFKELASRILTPYASGVLLDRQFAVTHAKRPDFVAPGCAMILAADVLHGERGEAVSWSTLDDALTPDFIRATGAAAIKLLIIWRRESAAEQRDVVDRFLELASISGVASFVEGIVRPPIDGAWTSPEDRQNAIVEAAANLSVGASVYKAEVPGYRPGDLSRVYEQSTLVSQAVEGPWVVLSNGVDRDEFAQAVQLSSAAGASGFLAGRAIWADTVAERDPERALRERSIARLKRLTAIIDASASIRPREDAGRE